MSVDKNKANIVKEALQYLKAKAYVLKLKEKKGLDANNNAKREEMITKKHTL